MISFLKGDVVEINVDYILVDVNELTKNFGLSVDYYTEKLEW